MKQFKITKDPYDDNKIFAKASVPIEPGVTVLVGCNGAGKTTMLRMIKEQLKKNKEAYIVFDNLREGNSSAMERYAWNGDIDRTATMFCSSEGERIMIVLGEKAGQIGRLAARNRDKDIFILFDAVDSGFSIDNIGDLKESLFDTVLEDHPKDVYIICTANSYEMARGQDCIDVNACKHIRFKDYEDYRNFILKSRKRKDKRTA